MKAPSNQEIRKFITTHFNDSDLNIFCFDYFPEVENNFAAGIRKNDKVIDLLTYCRTRQLMPNLLTNLQRERPIIYQQEFDPQESFSISAPKTKEQPRQAYEPELCTVPSGSFIMGVDTPSTPEYERQHIVDLPTYAISRYPITNALYATFIKKTNHPRPSDWRGGRIPARKEYFPVVYVSWHDAQAYCQWLSGQTNKLYRLPTEAEWEKAARGKDGLLYPWGDEWRDNVCNYAGEGVTAVNAFPSGQSIYGCEDMLGNTREWTSTLWGADYRTPEYPYPYQPDDREDNEVSDYILRVTRSCNFKDGKPQAGSASRRCYAPTNKNAHRGFRIVLTS